MIVSLDMVDLKILNENSKKMNMWREILPGLWDDVRTVTATVTKMPGPQCTSLPWLLSRLGLDQPQHPHVWDT